MTIIRRSVLVALLAFASACGGGGGSSGGGGSPAPPTPPLPAITNPATGVLPSGAPGVVYPTITFAATGTAPFSWSISFGVNPPGLALSADGIYSGIPLNSGVYTFTIRVADANGFITRNVTHTIIASVPESESNNTSGTADLLPEGATGTGTLPGGDVDFWTFSAAADDVIRIELFGTRRDFDAYDAGSIPKLTVLAPNGTSYLVGHDVTAPVQPGTTTGWFHGVHDMDIPAFRIPASGNYFLRIEPDLGPAGGAYAVRVASLLLGATQSETEQNGSPASANAITPGVIRGYHDDGDLDFYSFNITSTTIVTFEIFCYRNGIGANDDNGLADDDYFDPELLIIAPDGTTVVSGNDDVHFFDSKLSVLLGTSGVYYVLVQESQTVSAGDSEYVMTFEAAQSPTFGEVEPNDTPANADPIQYDDIVSGFMNASANDIDSFVFTGNAGDLVHVYWHDFGTNEQALDFVDVFLFADNPGGLAPVIGQTVSFWGAAGENATRAILPASGIYYVVVFPFGANTNYTLRLLRLNEGTFETASNDTVGTAQALPPSGNVAGAIPDSGDVDVFSFTAAEGEVVVFSIYAGPPVAPPGSNAFTLNSFFPTADLDPNVDPEEFELIPDLEILNFSGALLEATPAVSGTAFCTGEAIANGYATSGIAFVAPSSGTFYIRVSSNDGFVSDHSLYFLERR